MFSGGILGGFSDKKSTKIHCKCKRCLTDFLVDFNRSFTASRKAATLDPLKNSRVNRGVRHFHQVLKSIPKTLQIDAKIIKKSVENMFEIFINLLIDFGMDFERIFASSSSAFCIDFKT